MKDTKQILEAAGWHGVELITREMIERDMKASGAAIESLRVVATDTSVAIMGYAYIATLITGSKPWAKKPKKVPTWFVKKIAAWLRYKHKSEGAAGAVAHTIIHKGTRIYRRQRAPLPISYIAQQIADHAAQLLGAAYVAEIANLIAKENA